MTLNDLINVLKAESIKYGNYELVEINVDGEQEDLIIHTDDDEKIITIM